MYKRQRLDEPCSDLGIECGVTVEQWASAGDAEDRSDYILTILDDAPMLGSEYHYLDGAILVRVTGELPPSAAKEYETALTN